MLVLPAPKRSNFGSMSPSPLTKPPSPSPMMPKPPSPSPKPPSPSPKPPSPPPMMAQSLSPMMPQSPISKLNSSTVAKMVPMAKSPTPATPTSLPKPTVRVPQPRTDRMSRGSTIPPSPLMMPKTEMSSEVQGWDDEYFHETSEYPDVAPMSAPKSEDLFKGYQESTQIYKESETSTQPMMEKMSPIQPNMGLIDKLGGFDITQKINIQKIISDEVSNISGVNPLGVIGLTE